MSSRRSIRNGVGIGGRSRWSRTVVAVGTLALLASACDAGIRVDTDGPAPGGDRAATAPPSTSSPSGPSPDAASTSPAPSPTPSPAGSPTPSPAGSGSPPVAADSPNVTSTDRLLTAEELPTLDSGAEWAWHRGRTFRTEVPDPFGTCHRFAMTSVGATRVVVRGYRAGRDDAGGSSGGSGVHAGHLVATFADAKTARTAYDVLRAWHRDCDGRLREHDSAEVGELREVPVTEGEGRWYLLTYGPPDGGGTDEVYLDAQGMALHGTRVTVLRMRTVGGEASGSRLHEPIEAAVAAAVAQLG